NQDLPVVINDVTVGMIHTNDGGAGKLDLRSGFTHGHGHGTLPEGFTSLNTGDTVSVGPLTGIFFDPSVSNMQKVEVEGMLGDGSGSGVSGEVKYAERF